KLSFTFTFYIIVTTETPAPQEGVFRRGRPFVPATDNDKKAGNMFFNGSPGPPCVLVSHAEKPIYPLNFNFLLNYS
ncbi:MAG: hypothetical protein II150_00905, partial [Thermoguttaceae bacterium]|nr:hypothetical protein [Thermoguttaceae bacterium]